MNHLYLTALRLSILPILLFVLSVSCKEPTATRSYTVAFETNEGTTVKNQTVKEGEKASQPDNPTREGYAFGGWYRDKALTQSFDFNTAIIANITLYAKWDKTVFTVAFQSNGGSPVASITIAKGNTIKKPDNPTKKDSIFDAWYTGNTFRKSFEFANTPITADITLYAKWGQPVTVAFQTNGGTPIPPKTTAKNTTIKKPDNPTKQDSIFDAWYTDNTFQKYFEFANTPITADITLYAKWGEPVTVAFQTNGGSPITPKTLAKGNTIKKPTPTKGKSTLLSWYRDNGLTQPFSFDTPIIADITLYAKYGFRIPDDNFRGKVKSIVPAAFTEDVIDTAHSAVTELTFMDVSLARIKSLAGIEYFTALTELYCYNNQLTSLDLATNTALTYLNCNTNQLTSLDMSTNTKLTMLHCYNNQLTSLDMSTNTKLIKLNCYSNKLTSLDVATNTALTELDCHHNNLTTLDFATNTKLTALVCYNNQLTTLNLATNTQLTSLACYNNQLTSLDVATNTALTQLSCNENKLTSLDLATNTKLITFFCYKNKLTTLDLATNTKLTELYCYNNQLTTLDVATNTQLTALACSSNLLTRLDVATNTQLTSLSCNNNKLTSLDVATNTQLTLLYCHKNKLTSLDMRGIASVRTLYINAGSEGKNPLTSLRVLDAVKNNNEIKEVKTNRGGDIIITVYNDTDRTTVICNNYDPNQGTCLDP